MTPQRIFSLLLCLIVLLCAGIAIAVLAPSRNPEESQELRRQVDLAAANARITLEQLTLLKARVTQLESENERLLGQAAASVRAPAAAAPVDPFLAEPPSPGHPLTPTPAGSPDAFFESMTALLGGATNATPFGVTTAGKPSKAMIGFIRAAGIKQAREEAKSRSVELTSRLGLTEDQRTALEEALARNQESQMDSLEKLLSLEEAGSPADLGALTNQVQEAEVVRGILGGEQYKAYENWQAAENQSNKESFALESLSAVQRALPDLNQEQKDKLYQHYLSQSAFAPEVPGAGFLGTVIAQAGQDPEKEDQAFQDILTPAQYESWKARNQAGGFRTLRIGGGGAISVQSIHVEKPAAKPE